MLDGQRINVIIPALNEEASVGKVIEAIPDWVDEIVVADNGSTDRTAQVATQAGARVVHEPRRGYGQACLTALDYQSPCEVVVFLDGDFSDHPEEMGRLVEPIIRDRADLVIGSRILGRCEPDALTPQQRFGNALSCWLMAMFWNVRFTDLGPFRAVRATALERLDMRDRNYGWTVEMQIKAAQCGLTTREAPVSYRKRIGQSKVSGTVKGVVGAGTKILWTILVAAVTRRGPPREKLVVFTRYPEPGKTKTRLAPALGPQGAADLHARMVEHTLAWVRRLRRRRPLRVEISFEGGDREAMGRWLGEDFKFRPQGDGGLGARMDRAFAEGFRAGMASVVIVGTDCPGITVESAERAFTGLRDHDLVLGPAADGGYYLIGLTRRTPELFAGMSWGQGDVLAETLRTAERLRLSVALLDTLHDVDRPEDLPVWHAISGDSSGVGKSQTHC